MKLRSHLIALVVVAALPVLIFALVMVVLFSRETDRRTLWMIAGGGLLPLGGIALAVIVGRRIARPIRARGGKVYVDFGQNGHGRTIVAPFSVRPLPGATVSCPLRWEEVTARLDPGRFTMKTIPQRCEKMKDPLAPVLTGSIDMATAVSRIEKQLGHR